MINNNEKKNKKKDITAKYDFNSGLKQSISKKRKIRITTLDCIKLLIE